MKVLPLLAIAFGLSQITKAQEVTTTVDCNQTGLVVNVGSYPNMVSLYHSGNYLTWPQSSNVIVWKITDTQDNLIAQDTIVGESLFSFAHDLSLTDTINVSAHLTNDAAIHEGFPVNCLIEDQLYWEITEVIPPQELFPDGMYTESWSFVHEPVGVDQNDVLDINDVDFNIKPSLMRIVDILGRETPVKPNTVLFYIYSDGSVEKKYISK